MRHFSKSSFLNATKLVLGVGLALPTVAAANDSIALNAHPTRLIAFETANMYQEGAVELSIGTSQVTESGGSGTGNQTYFGGGAYALSDKVTLGFDLGHYRDPVLDPINGLYPSMRLESVGVWGKFGLVDNGPWKVSALVALEDLILMDSPLWGGWSRHTFIGAVKAPITYSVSPDLQFNITPAVTYLPDTVNGAAFYGTIASLGAGVSYRPTERLSLFGSVDVPVSGTNTITNTATYDKYPVWTAGGRYNVTPKVAIEGFATNGVGMTPATSILTHWPDGERVLAGLRLVYTPGAERPESYRGVPAAVTARQKNLQLDGFTLGSADVLEPGHMSVSAWYGADNNAGLAFGFSPDRDGEIQVMFEQYSDNPTADPSLIPSTDVRYMFGPKLRLLDQNNGNAYTLTGRLLYGRSNNSTVGSVLAELLASYKANDALTLTASARAAAFGNREIAGLGLGINYEVVDGVELIGEVTPVGFDASDPTWAAGVRYNLGSSGFAVDLLGTNAIGRQGIGSMVAQDDVRFSLTLNKVFDLRPARFY